MKYGCVLTAYFTAVRTRFQFALCFMLAFILLAFILLSFILLSFVLLSFVLLFGVFSFAPPALRLWLSLPDGIFASSVLSAVGFPTCFSYRSAVIYDPGDCGLCALLSVAF